MSRQKLSLGEPPDEQALRDFPRTDLTAGHTLWRVTRRPHGPWWFGSRGAGRFDLEEPRGTCYLSTDPLTAVLEILGPDRFSGLVSAEVLAQRQLWQVAVPSSYSLADLTSRQAAGFGVTLELHGHPRYELSQRWARALDASGAEGLLYYARHDPSAGENIALFGPAGEEARWDRGEAIDLDQPQLLERLRSECRIRVAAPPYRSEIPVLD